MQQPMDTTEEPGARLAFPAKTAEPPFDGARGRGDAILLTADNVSFYIAKTVLAFASPFFEDMFSLTQPPSDPTTSVAGELPVIDVSEDSVTMDHLLRFCYPIADPVISTVEELGRVLEAASKYQMDEATEISKKLLDPFIKERPLDVFVIACRMHDESLALQAAQAWKQMRSSRSSDFRTFASTTAGASFVPAMEQISAGQYYRLIEYVAGTSTDEVSLCDAPSGSTLDVRADNALHSATEISPLDNDTRGADIIFRSSDDIEFPAHTLVLRLAGVYDLLWLNRSDPQTPEATNWTSPLTIDVAIHAHVISALLRLCYPFSNPSEETIKDLPTLFTLARLSVRYHAVKLIAKLRDQLASSTLHHPLAIFFLCDELGWHEQARKAAQRAFDYPEQALYTSEMEQYSALVYYNFLDFRHQCRYAVAMTMRERSRSSFVEADAQLRRRDLQWLLSDPILEPGRGPSYILMEKELKKAFTAGMRSNSSTNSGSESECPSYAAKVVALMRKSDELYHAAAAGVSAVPLKLRGEESSESS